MTKTLTSIDNSPKWYFVHCPDLPNRQVLESHGITLSSKSYISRGFFNLFLSFSQVDFLVKECNAEVSEVEDKLIANAVPLHSADYLILEVSESFNPSNHKASFFDLDPISSTTYFVNGSDIKRIVSYFDNINEVYSITPAYRPKLKNHLAAGYSQLNTKQLDETRGFARYLQEQGLTGEGVVVTVMDDEVDLSSTFFYDAANPLPGPNHRKILVDVDPGAVSNSSHGTHVAGTIAGNSSNSNASLYNGVAPGAKLIHFRGIGGDNTIAGMFYLQKAYMEKYRSQISSNSWGIDRFFPSVIQSFDSLASENLVYLFIFAAGNEQKDDYYQLNGSMTLCSPSPSKNVIAVGALSHLTVENVTSDQRIVMEVDTNSFGSFHYFGKLVPWSRNPFNDTVRVLDNNDHRSIVLNSSEWSIADPPYDYALIFDDFSLSNVTFPVFYYDDPACRELLAELTTKGITPSISIYQEFQTGTPRLASFSSQGPSMTGIIKPDVVAPGEHISSARSKASGEALHDENPLNLQRMSGTSMATPNVAGSAALIQQYFGSGFYPRKVEQPASFLKGMLIHCADPIPPDRKFPNHQFGFGQINIGRYLPFNSSSFSILVNESISIGPSQHLVSNVSILSNEGPLRITISYLDPAASADSLVPLLADLDLIVLSRTGKVFRGNHYLNGSEEHFSTTERVILNPDEIEIGDYEIHVISSFLDVVEIATFSIIVTGNLSKSQSNIEFRNATSCLPSINGTCNSSTLINKCPSTRIGQSCQIEVNIVPVSENPVNHSFTVQPLESLYVRLEKPSDADRLRVSVSGDAPVLLRFFVAIDTTPNGIPFKYQRPVWNNRSMRSNWEEEGAVQSVVDLLIRNEFSVPWGFRVWGKTVSQATVAPPNKTSVPTSPTAAASAVPPTQISNSLSTSNSGSTSPSAAAASAGLSGGVIATIVIVPVVVIAAAVVIIFIVRGRRNQDMARFDGP